MQTTSSGYTLKNVKRVGYAIWTAAGVYIILSCLFLRFLKF